MCIYCYTFIQLDDYWIKKFGLAINKKNYISMDNWSQLVHQLVDREIKYINNMIKDLHLETEVSLIDEDGINEKKWIQMNRYFDYCLEDLKKGQSDLVKSVGKIIPTEIIDTCDRKPICCNIFGGTYYAYEKGD
uniref:Uncharacterized protein n=1 Tax=viral metagenome TaxID=1070528 RepID=A0A6C0HKB3_9ZZZZ